MDQGSKPCELRSQMSVVSHAFGIAANSIGDCGKMRFSRR